MLDVLKELFAEELEEADANGFTRGESNGIALTKAVFKLAGSGKSPELIAIECGISKEKVLEILE